MFFPAFGALYEAGLVWCEPALPQEWGVGEYFGFAACCEDGLGPSVIGRLLPGAAPFDSEDSL